jgi:hypothetical protein
MIRLFEVRYRSLQAEPIAWIDNRTVELVGGAVRRAVLRVDRPHGGTFDEQN